ncbi:MAG: CDP-alcohol phosphatidyltransferase family protein [Aggregatilineales bacterium]
MRGLCRSKQKVWRVPDSSPTTLTDHIRKLTGGIINPMGRFLHRLGIHPDAVTIFGLLLTGVAGVMIAMGELQWGGIVLLLSLPMDALDGAVARAMKRTNKFGAVLDSVLDRYADAFIFAALSYYFAAQGRMEMLLMAQFALMGSLLVSYVRARGDGVQVAATVGLFTRFERIVVILLLLLIPSLTDAGVILLAIGTNFTALQRLYYINQQLRQQD